MKHNYSLIALVCAVSAWGLSSNLQGQTAEQDSVFLRTIPEITWTRESLEKDLPSSVDNSTLQEGYMPPIFNQWYTGSCIQCAEIAYTFTYEMNRQRGVSAGSSWTGNENQRTNLYHPFFTYNFLNKGNGNGNSWTCCGDGFKIVSEIG